MTAKKKIAKKATATIQVGTKSIIRVDPGVTENTGQFGWCIVVADRGFVWVGDTQRCGDSVYIADGQNIRQWGTSKGLGELAMKGPQSETELDPVPCVVVPMRAVIAFVPCDREAWEAGRKKHGK